VTAGPGLFIAFEGGEGAGKSTQIQHLAQWLQGQGHRVVTTREPGGTLIGSAIRSLLLDPATGEMDPRTEALLYAADRAEHVASVIRPALSSGATVISDRFVDSSLAYQGAGRILDRDEVEQLSRWASKELTPDLTVILDIDPRLGLARLSGADRLESLAVDFHDRVRQGFVDLAQRAPHRYAVIDASLPEVEVRAAVVAAVDAMLQQRAAESATS